MLNKSDDLICLQLSDDVFKAVQIKGGAKGKIIQVSSLDIKGLSDSELTQSIQTSLKKFNTKSADFVCVVPASMTTTKNVEIPSTNTDEIKSIVNLQASRHTPFSREEIQIGYINTGVYKSNFTKVLLIIANRLVIKKHLDIFERAGFKVRAVLFSPEATAHFYSENLSPSPTTPVGIIDVGKMTTEFIISNNGFPIFVRGISIGAYHLNTDAGQARNKLIDELSKTLDSYKAEDIDQVPTRFVFTTAGDLTKDLSVAIKDKLKWDTEVDPYIDYIKPADGVLNQLGVEYSDQSFLDVVAASSIVGEAQVNLMPEEIQLQKSVEDQGQEVLRTTMLGFIILIVLAVSFGLKLYFTSAFLTKLKATNQNNDKKVSELKQRSLKTNVIESYLKERMVSLDVLNELYRNIPNEIYLTNLLMDENGNITVQGISDIPSLVFNLGSSLKESVLFKSVDIKSTTAKKDRGKDVSAFEISLKLKSAMEDPAAKTKEEGKAKQ